MSFGLQCCTKGDIHVFQCPLNECIIVTMTSYHDYTNAALEMHHYIHKCTYLYIYKEALLSHIIIT